MCCTLICPHPLHSVLTQFFSHRRLTTSTRLFTAFSLSHKFSDFLLTLIPLLSNAFFDLSRLYSNCSLLLLQVTMSSHNIIIPVDFCLISSSCLSISIADKKGLFDVLPLPFWSHLSFLSRALHIHTALKNIPHYFCMLLCSSLLTHTTHFFSCAFFNTRKQSNSLCTTLYISLLLPTFSYNAKPLLSALCHTLYIINTQ